MYRRKWRWRRMLLRDKDKIPKMNSSKQQQLCRRRFFKKCIFGNNNFAVDYKDEWDCKFGRTGGWSNSLCSRFSVSSSVLFLLLFCFFYQSSYITFKLFCFIIYGLCSFLSLMFVLLLNVSFFRFGLNYSTQSLFFFFLFVPLL